MKTSRSGIPGVRTFVRQSCHFERAHHFRSTTANGHQPNGPSGPFRARNGRGDINRHQL